MRSRRAVESHEKIVRDRLKVMTCLVFACAGISLQEKCAGHAGHSGHRVA